MSVLESSGRLFDQNFGLARKIRYVREASGAFGTVVSHLIAHMRRDIYLFEALRCKAEIFLKNSNSGCVVAHVHIVCVETPMEFRQQNTSC